MARAANAAQAVQSASGVRLRWPVCPLAARRIEVWERLAGLAQVVEAQTAGGVIETQELLFVSSPAEWTAEQWQDAALRVLEVEQEAAGRGWTLENVSLSGIQFSGCRPLWTDWPALVPVSGGGGPWPGRESFLRSFVVPLLRLSCGLEAFAGQGRTPLSALRQWRALKEMARGYLAPVWKQERGREAARLRKAIESIVVRRGWAPWTASAQAPAQAGLAPLLIKEEVRLRAARIVYELCGPRPVRPFVTGVEGVAWIRFHQSDAGAAAEYLEERALRGGAALPLVNRSGDPIAACPGRRPADVVALAGPDTPPLGGRPLVEFARLLARMGRTALVERVETRPGVPMAELAAAFSPWFRLERIEETGPGRWMCVFSQG